MCTVILLRRPGHAWPLIFAANRDEMEDRPWTPPARHWDDRAEVTAGRDDLGGGTWLGVNDYGVVAGVLNRHGTLGPAEDKRSRGELPLEALDHETAQDAADALAHLDSRAYRPFNLVIADHRDAFWLAARADAPRIHVAPIAEGLHMLSAHDLDDTQHSARIRRFLPEFSKAPEPDPDSGDFAAWADLLARRDTGPEAGPDGAMCVDIPFESGRFGTRSSSLIALPAPAQPPRPPIWRFCHGAPDSGRWTDIAF